MKMKSQLLLMRTVILSVLALLSLNYGLFAQQSGRNDVILQGFHWEAADATKKDWWQNLNSKVGDISSAGFDAIWLPPPSDAADRAGYLPRKWYDLNSNYGTEAELRTLISNLGNNNVQAIADIVINHRVGSTGWADFTEPSLGGCSSICADDEVNWSEYSTEKGAACGDNDSGTQYEAARDLNHNSFTVRDEVKKWMNWLKNDVGYDGWRYDFVHGFNAYYFAEYNNATSPYISIGEQWKPYNEIVSWLNGAQNTSSAFDFPLKYTLHDAVNGNYNYLNGLPSLLGTHGNQAVSFLENHDTEPVRSEYGNNSFPNDPSNNSKLLQGYAYILTHPGIPVVFYSHYFDYGIKDALRDMISIRKANNITNTSYVQVEGQNDNSYYAAIIDNKVAMKIGGGNWSPGNGWNLKVSGPGYAIWDKGTVITLPELTLNTPSGNYSAGCANVSLSATEGTIYYTLDGSTPTSASAVYTGAFDICGNPGEVKTLKAIAINENGSSDVVERTYTFNEASTMTVYFKANCSNPSIYFWGVVDGTATTTWPGVSMQASSKYEGYYEYTIEGSCTNLILLCDGSKVTDDEMNICGDVWYDNGWVPEPQPITPDTEAPTTSITPDGGTFDGSVTITLSATDNEDTNPKIYYSTDGSTPSEVAYGSTTVTLTADATVQYYAEDASGNTSTLASSSFTVNENNTGGGFKVHVKGYNMIYHWGAVPSGSVANAVWPGATMTMENGWYVYEFPAGVQSTSLLFHDGNGNQTDDMIRDKEGWFENGQWSDQAPQPASGLVVHYKSTWGNSTRIHYWGASNGTSSNWPGEIMTDEGNGWYTYTIEGATSSNLLFHNGAGAQTGDLNRSGEGWYKDGTWYASNPEGSNGRTTNSLLLEEDNLKLYPTIVSNQFTLDVSVTTPVPFTMQAFDLNGQQVLTSIHRTLESGVSKINVPVKDLSKGLYLIKVSVGDKKYVKRIVIN
ncbi:starch-binding protein [Flammeovirga sp. EKP202]|uniref:starch-binding protein n=1 Tax=Flammeovirga sp. EKP202 TaxID=2770592 RepID=UPI00165F6289|nr:starch-binding protein [Flammeovirga sp. EKP202]